MVWVSHYGVLQLIDCRVGKPQVVVGAMGDSFIARACGMACLSGGHGGSGGPWDPIVMAAAHVESEKDATRPQGQQGQAQEAEDVQAGTMRIFDIRGKGASYTQILPPPLPREFRSAHGNMAPTSPMARASTSASGSACAGATSGGGLSAPIAASSSSSVAADPMEAATGSAQDESRA